MIYDTFSKRPKHTKVSQVEIPRTLRNQIIPILDQIIQDKWENLWHAFCDEEGKPQSERNIDFYFHQENFVDADDYHNQLDAIMKECRTRCCNQIEEGTMNNVFDMIDIAFQFTYKTIQDEQASEIDWRKKEATYRRAVEDINIRFKEAKIGYQLLDNRTVLVDSNDENTQQETKQERILNPEDYDNEKTDRHLNNDREKTPKTAEVYYNRGFWYLQEGDCDGAIKNFTESLSQQPDNVYALLNRGSAWAKKDEYDKAIEDYNEAIQIKPDFASAWSYRGITWYSKGEYDKAIEDLSRALFLEPNDVNAWKVRGEAFLEKGEYDKSIVDYKEARRLSPADEEIIQKQTIAMALKRSLGENTNINKKRKRIVKTTVKKIKIHDFDHELESTLADLNSLIDNSPTSRVAPAFGFADDGLLHINLPPDLQDAPSGDEVFEELKAAKNDLKQALEGSNAHLSLLAAVEQYDQAFSNEQISISLLYVRGIRLENAVDAIRQNIASGDLPPFSIDIERNINSVLKLHGTYIMSLEEGRVLVEGAYAYRQSPQQMEETKVAAEKLSNFITNDTNLFGEDIKEHVANVVPDIGKGTHLERSNQVVTATFIGLTTGILRGIVNNPAVGVMAGAALLESMPGASLVTLATETINAAWFFISNTIPLLKVMVTSVASDASWIVSLSYLVDRFKNLQNPRD